MDTAAPGKVDASVRGLPRPILDGLPAPYSGDDSRHGYPDDERMAECYDRDVCAVCGNRFTDSRRYVAQEAREAEIGATSLVDDGLLMHERCAKLALAHCPHMKHGFSQVFWVDVDELNHDDEGMRSLYEDNDFHARERRMTLKSTSVGVDRSGWLPRSER